MPDIKKILIMISFALAAIALQAQQAVPEVDISLLPSADETFELIDHSYKQPLLVEKIIFQSDVSINPLEWREIIGIKEGSFMCAQDIKKACWHLKRKNKFDTVKITADPGKNGWVLTWQAVGLWTFDRVECKGALVEKERYRQAYLLHAHEVFDIAKHQHSLRTIAQELKNQGYNKARICDYIAYEKETKTVSVTLYVEDTQRFSIGNVTAEIITHAQEPLPHEQRLCIKIKNMLYRELASTYYSKSAVDQQIDMVKNYLIGKGYLTARIEAIEQLKPESCTLDIGFKVHLCQKKKFMFFGNHFFTTQQLHKEVLIVGDCALLVPPALLAEDISELYKKRGFWNVKVSWREEAERYVFVIKEGSRVKINSVEIAGLQNIVNQDQMNSITQPLIQATYFDADLLKKSLTRLSDVCLQNGFWDVLIHKEKYICTANDTYKIRVKVTLGAQRLLKGVEVVGYSYLQKEEPFSTYSNLKQPIVFNVEIVQEQRQWLLKHLHQKGFLYAKVRPELKQEIDGICLRWHVESDFGQVTFGKTIIQGVSKLNPKILMRELYYREGEPFDQEKVTTTLRRLKTLGIFESVSLLPYNGLHTPESSKTMILSCVQDYPFEVRTRLGFAHVSKSFTQQPGSTYKLGGSFVWKNPNGLADQLFLNADITRFTRDVSAYYQLPWLGTWPIITNIGLYSTMYEQPLITGSREKLYQATDDGFELKLQQDYAHATAQLSLGACLMKISGLSHTLAQKICFEPALINKRTPYFSLEPTISFDYVDNKLNPKRGSATVITANAMIAPSVQQSAFLKVLLEQSFFWPLYKDSVIAALRIRAGHIFNKNFNTLMPTERFYLGGPNTVRGYEINMVPPLSEFKDTKECSYWVPVGGKSMLNINTELRFGLHNNIGGVLFTDMGVLTQEARSTIQASNWVGASGVGLRYNTPFGPLRFDIGWKWHKRREDDKSYAWFLTLGHAF